MINRDDFIATVQAATSEQDYLQITRKYILHGIPYVFERRENDYFDFRANIAKQFDIGFHEVFRHSCISPWQYNHVIQRS